MAAVKKQENVLRWGNGVSEAGTLKGEYSSESLQEGLLNCWDYRLRGGVLSRALMRLRTALLRHRRCAGQIILRAILCSDFYLCCFLIFDLFQRASGFYNAVQQPQRYPFYCAHLTHVTTSLRRLHKVVLRDS